MSITERVFVVWGVSAVVMLVLWLVQLRTRNAGIVDAGWAAGVGAAGVFFAITGEGAAERRWLVAALLGIWSCRLALYLVIDRCIGQAEDGRYEMLRRSWAPRANAFFFGFFQVQASWVLLFSLPALAVAQNSRALDIASWGAIGLWLIAFFGETIADRQLARFRSRPESKGKTCREGLWRYSRHPNYFFEWLHWWVYVLLAIGTGWFWVALAIAVLMFFFISYLTGIPYTEKRALITRGEDYRQYQASTSRLIPWPPRETAAVD